MKARISAPLIKPRSAVPLGMLSLLMLAFGGSLALKAFEERQFADSTVLTQQAREAEALAGHVRAELVASRARMEGLLLTGASLEAIRRGVNFDAVAERDPPESGWAQLTDKSGVRVFARNAQGRWVSGVRTKDSIVPEALDGRTFHLVPTDGIPMAARFEIVDFERSAVACAPVESSGVAACVFRPAPLFGLGDLNRLIIYGLLLTAPLLAVFGLVGVIRRVEREKQDVQARLAAAPSRSAADEWRSFEVGGVFGLWRWDPAAQLLTIGPAP
jgi:two-component system cell cycle sensor histidine kinase PleC